MIVSLCRMFPGLDPRHAWSADARLLRLADVYMLAHPPEAEPGE